jgi:hypothetical protein
VLDIENSVDSTITVVENSADDVLERAVQSTRREAEAKPGLLCLDKVRRDANAEPGLLCADDDDE